MNFSAALLNLALFVYTCFILRPEGLPKDVAYFLFTLFLLLVPLLNITMIYLGVRRKGWFSFNWKGKVSEEPGNFQEENTSGRIMKTFAIISNVALLLLSVLAYLDQYPHPEEDGLVLFILSLWVTPVISILVIWRNGTKIIQDSMYSGL
jgi:hypothetical protein